MEFPADTRGANRYQSLASSNSFTVTLARLQLLSRGCWGTASPSQREVSSLTSLSLACSLVTPQQGVLGDAVPQPEHEVPSLTSLFSPAAAGGTRKNLSS